MTAISTNYRPMSISELATVRQDGWKNPDIPRKQYESCVKQELETFRNGGHVDPFDALVRCLYRLPREMNHGETTLLDAGCSSGYYSEVLDIAGFKYSYTGIDFSESFLTFARQLYPDLTFECQNAGHIQYPDGVFDIVLSSAVMMHCLDYVKVLAEAVRVSNRYILLHRTPVLTDKKTSYFVKDAYGVPVIEVHFAEHDLWGLFARFGLMQIHYTDVFREEGFAHRTYLLRKGDLCR